MAIGGSILVFRFSAMGDVAMSASVVRELMVQNPGIQVIIVSRPLFKAFFSDIKDVTFHSLDTKGRHRGIGGLYELYRELKRYEVVGIADLHDNLRSRILSSYFRLTNIPIARIDKNRTKKKKLTRRKDKEILPLRRTVQSYADVFVKLGFRLKLSNKLVKVHKEVPNSFSHYFTNNDYVNIGISPFAQHKTKVYPLHKMEEVVKHLSAKGYRLFIFGGGEEERMIAEEWQKRMRNIYSLISKVSLEAELAIISKLDLMISMDSAGMHLASLMGVGTLSIWGSTHPYAGFLGYGQKEENCVQIDLYCRPCSVYGNKPCYRGDHACMHGITSGTIIAMVEKMLTQ